MTNRRKRTKLEEPSRGSNFAFLKGQGSEYIKTRIFEKAQFWEEFLSGRERERHFYIEIRIFERAQFWQNYKIVQAF